MHSGTCSRLQSLAMDAVCFRLFFSSWVWTGSLKISPAQHGLCSVNTLSLFRQVVALSATPPLSVSPHSESSTSTRRTGLRFFPGRAHHPTRGHVLVSPTVPRRAADRPGRRSRRYVGSRLNFERLVGECGVCVCVGIQGAPPCLRDRFWWVGGEKGGLIGGLACDS